MADAETVPLPPQLQDANPGEGMRVLGWLLMLAGLLMMMVGAFSPTTVTTEATYIMGERVGGGEVHNLGLIARNLSVLLIGGFAMVTGAVLIAVGTIRQGRVTPLGSDTAATQGVSG